MLAYPLFYYLDANCRNPNCFQSRSYWIPSVSLVWRFVKSDVPSEGNGMCLDVPICAEMCLDVPRCAEICQDESRCAEMCRDVLRCAKICRDVPRWVEMCRDVPRCAEMPGGRRQLGRRMQRAPLAGYWVMGSQRCIWLGATHFVVMPGSSTTLCKQFSYFLRIRWWYVGFSFPLKMRKLT